MTDRFKIAVLANNALTVKPSGRDVKDGDINATITELHRVIRLIDPVTFVVPGTAGARAPVVVEKFGAELRRAPAQFHHCFSVNTLFYWKATRLLTGRAYKLSTERRV